MQRIINISEFKDKIKNLNAGDNKKRIIKKTFSREILNNEKVINKEINPNKKIDKTQGLLSKEIMSERIPNPNVLLQSQIMFVSCKK